MLTLICVADLSDFCLAMASFDSILGLSKMHTRRVSGIDNSCFAFFLASLVGQFLCVLVADNMSILHYYFFLFLMGANISA